MAKVQAVEEGVKLEEVAETVHPLKKSYMLVSKRHIDLNALTAFESVSMSLVFVLAVLAGVVTSLNIV